MFKSSLRAFREFAAGLHDATYADPVALSLACWSALPPHLPGICETFRERFGALVFVRSIELSPGAHSARQGATSVKLIFASPDDSDFAVRLEFLLEHPAEYLSVVKRATRSRPHLDRVADLIEGRERPRT